jgi:hypothetical protein
MELHNYTNEKKYLGLYKELLDYLYGDYPQYVALRFKEFEKNINTKNPFHLYGGFRNFILIDNGKPVAHISAIVDSRLPKEVGLVGYFECVDSTVYAKEIFNATCEFLKKNEKSVIHGPVDFTTWQNFRISYPSSTPPFFTEPYTLSYYKDLFEDFGFTVAQCNITKVRDVARGGLIPHEDSFIAARKTGFSFTVATKDMVVDLLPEIYKITLESFRDTWSFIPVSYEEFEYQHDGVDTHVDSGVVVVVHALDGKLAGFCFSVADIFCKDKKKLVVKTLGISPEFQGGNTGKATLYFTEATAKQAGFEMLYYSTMRTDNKKIQSMTGNTHDIYRKYAAYELNI